MLSQKDGVFNAVEAYLDECGREFEEGMEVKLSTEDRKTVIGMLVHATEASEIDVKSPKARLDLKSYWSGCLSNWLRKDTRLNGGSKYEAKNPGSRQGVGDKQLKALKQLLTKVKGTEHEKAVNEHIAQRLSELEVLKASKVEIDVSFLPDSLKNLV